MIEMKDLEYFEFLNDVLEISKNIISYQIASNRIILESYDLSLFKYKLDREITKLDKMLEK